MMLSAQQKQILVEAVQGFPFEDQVKSDLLSAIEAEPTKELSQKVFEAMKGQVVFLKKMAEFLKKEDEYAMATIEAELDEIEQDLSEQFGL